MTRRSTVRCLALLAAVAASGACASAPAPADGAPALPGQAVVSAPEGRRDRNRITEQDVADLRSRGAMDALTLIERARPHWLRVRRPEMQSGPLVLYNDRRLSGTAELRRIAADQVISMEYISPPASVGRYGRQAEFGAIIVHGR